MPKILRRENSSSYKPPKSISWSHSQSTRYKHDKNETTYIFFLFVNFVYIYRFYCEYYNKR